MPEAITPEIFKKLVGLASLDVGKEEGEYLRQELNNQLSSVAELEAIPLDEDLKITSHGVAQPIEVLDNHGTIKPHLVTKHFNVVIGHSPRFTQQQQSWVAAEKHCPKGNSRDPEHHKDRLEQSSNDISAHKYTHRIV